MTAAPRRLWLALAAGGLVAGGAAWWAARPQADPSTGSNHNPPAEDVPAGPGWFRDATAGSGIDFTYRNGEEANLLAILESLGGGVALIDYDGDGLLDVFLPGGGYFTG